MASFRAVRTMGDLPLRMPCRDDSSSDSSSSEDSPSEGSSFNNGAQTSNSRCVGSSASTSVSDRAALRGDRGGVRQLQWSTEDKVRNDSADPDDGETVATEVPYFERDQDRALFHAAVTEAPRCSFTPVQGEALAQEVESTSARSSLQLCKKQLRARFSNSPVENGPPHRASAGPSCQGPVTSSTDKYFQHRTEGSLPYFQHRTEGSLPAIDLEELGVSVRESSKSSRSSHRSGSKSAARSDSVVRAEPPSRRSLGPSDTTQPGSQTARPLSSRHLTRDSSFEFLEPPGEQDKPRVPAEEGRARRVQHVEEFYRLSSAISPDPLAIDDSSTAPQQSLLTSVLRKIPQEPSSPTLPVRRSSSRHPSVHIDKETRAMISTSSLDEEALPPSRRSSSRHPSTRIDKESVSFISVTCTSFMQDEEPPSPTLRPVSRSSSRRPSMRLDRDTMSRVAPAAPCAGIPRATTPLVPQAPAAPSAPTRPMRRLQRPVRRGWGGSSQTEPQAEGADSGEQEESEQTSPFAGLISRQIPLFDQPANPGEVYRATFADHQGRASVKEGQSAQSLEYRPRIKFLNILSAVTATVPEYVEAVAQEVCKAVLATRVFVLFADDIREQVYCMGLGDVACDMRWKGGIAGNIVKDGVQGRFGHTDDSQFTKLVGCALRCYLCTPIRHMLDQGRNIGGIVAINKIGSPGAEFTDNDLKVLQDISRLASDSFYRQRWKALENASAKGDSEALALISSTKPKLQGQDPLPDSAGPETQAKMDLLSQKVSWVELPVEVRTAKLSKLQNMGFDALEHTPEELLSFVEIVFQHTGCVERCAIPLKRLRNWACGAKWKYHDNPFHNWFHGFSVFQVCYYQLSVSPLQELFTTLDVFGLLIASLCHDLDHPGFTNNFMVDSQSELALRHNDIAVLENHHASLACELLRRDATAIGAGLDAASQKSLRRVIIKCILDTDMAHHSEMCQKLLASGSTEDRQLMLGACIHSSDLSGQTLPWKTAKKWEERISMEFTKQAEAELAAGRSPAPFMSFQMEDVKQRGKLQRDFCDFVLLPLWDPYTQQLPALRPCYRNLVKNRSFYEHRWSTGEDPDPQWYR